MYALTLLVLLLAQPTRQQFQDGFYIVHGTENADVITIAVQGKDVIVNVNGTALPKLPIQYTSFDEQLYLQLYPDVAAAVKAGFFGSGRHHYYEFGRHEGRTRYFDGGYYLRQNPDVDTAVQAGFFQSGLEHFLQYGHKEGRQAAPNTSGVHTVVVYALGGNDLIDCRTTISTIQYGGPGEDMLCGGDGADNLFGGDERDQLLSRNGNDYLRGGKGPDVLAAYGEGVNVVHGNLDVDTISFKLGRFIEDAETGEGVN